MVTILTFEMKILNFVSLNLFFFFIRVIIDIVVVMKIVLLNGESYLLINEKIADIIQDTKNVTTFDLSMSSIDDVLIEAGYFSMFEESKYIIVKNANFFGTEKLKDEEVEKLLHYMEHPNENTTIIFVCNTKLDSRKKITKYVKEHYSIITIPNLKYYEIENRVRDYFKKFGFKIGDDAVSYIVSNSLNNYDIVMGEVEKILLYYNDACNIPIGDVKKIVSHSINSNNFLFVDAVVDNDLEKSLEYLDDLKIMKVEPSILISLLGRDFRIMAHIKKMMEDGAREYEMMSDLSLADWQLEKYLKKVFPYKLKELESILVKLANLDLDIKSGKVDRFMGLELFILDLCE